MSLISPVRPDMSVDTLRKVKEASFLDGLLGESERDCFCNAGFEVRHDQCGIAFLLTSFLASSENPLNR